MKILNIFFVAIILSILFNCKNEKITNDEYEIINLFTSQIKSSFPAPPLINNNHDFSMNTQVEYFKKDSIKKSKIDFTIYLEDSLKGLNKDFQNQLYERNIGFDEFYLKEINNDLMQSKKIDLKKLKFPKNIKLATNYDEDFSKWKDNFLGKYWISRIIFNKEKSKAVLEFNHICGNLCGGGSKIYLSKRNGKWKIQYFFSTWVS